MVKDELSPTYASFLCDFNKCSDDRMSEKGINICKRIKSNLKYYEEVEKDLRNKAIKGKPKFVHGADNFLVEFNSVYQ